MTDDFVAQTFGFVSLTLGLSTFYQKDDRKLKWVMLLLNISHLIHFLLLGSLTSVLGALLSALRTGAAIYTKSIWVACLFIIATLVIGANFAENWYQMLPLAGTIVGTFSIFLLKGIALRIGFLIGAGCWLGNNLIIGSIGGSLLEMAVITMNIITIYRLYRNQVPLKV
jgi:hypothetical protein